MHFSARFKLFYSYGIAGYSLYSNFVASAPQIQGWIVADTKINIDDPGRLLYYNQCQLKGGIAAIAWPGAKEREEELRRRSKG